MTEFLAPVDIGNRALQHCGQQRMGTAGFSEVSRNAAEISACYGKLRRAELRRNVWAFSIRRAVVRPITTTTMLLTPALWSSVTTYFRGSIVIDAFGTPWISQENQNLNRDPLTTTSWEQYFGPLSVSLYDSTTTYFAGELVYTTPGDGTYRVYLSLVSGNADNPATGTTWDATVTYMRDQVVTFAAENDSFTKVLLHLDGADASTTITDSNVGGSAHTWTASGNAQIDTAQSKFGGASGLFDGTGDWVSTPDSADFTLGSGDFTVDCWFRCNAAGGTTQRIAGQNDNTASAGSSSFRIQRTAGNVITGIAFQASNISVVGTTQFTDAVNPGWHHVAFVRTGNTLKLFIDGVQEGGDVSITGAVNDSSNALAVGAAGEFTSNPWTGWIDEFRLSVGVARWTANFTPPASAYASTAATYMSRIDFNLNKPPSASAPDWSSGATYVLNAMVTGSDGVAYKSLADSNVGHDPVASPSFWQSQGFLTPWDASFTGGTGSLKWLQIGGAEFPMGVGLAVINALYPVDIGPSPTEGQRNVFRKPANFLRMAARDPKAGSWSELGAPSGLAYNDWNQEGDFVVSRESQPLVLRFAADVVDVRRMDDMFCEGLGARIGLEVCETLTQSATKIGTIASAYEKFMGDARRVNSIEIGAEEPPLDDYISARW